MVAATCNRQNRIFRRCNMFYLKQKQAGFTLVEIAIVLVIIGLLLGGILKGQELINSARVRNLADQNSGVQAAYYGFIDRYRQVPGDWLESDADTAIGVAINSPTAGGNEGNGRIDSADWEEASAVWEHLSKAGFIQGSYDGGANNEATYTSPVNAFNGRLLLARMVDFMTTGNAISGTERLALVIGDNIPVSIARELDVKVDDSLPNTGILRIAPPTGTGTMDFDTVSGSSSANCVIAADEEYDIANDAQGCNLVFLY